MNMFFYGQGDLFDLAAAYGFHIAQNQPFVDGNKRTAITAALAFIELNGISTSGLAADILYDAMIAIAEKRLDKAGLAEVFRRAPEQVKRSGAGVAVRLDPRTHVR